MISRFTSGGMRKGFFNTRAEAISGARIPAKNYVAQSRFAGQSWAIVKIVFQRVPKLELSLKIPQTSPGRFLFCCEKKR